MTSKPFHTRARKMTDLGSVRDRTDRGMIQTLRYLGRIEPADRGSRPVAVFYLTYRCAALGSCDMAAKLFLPVGAAPREGWPISIWSHGFGDPASDFRRWPFVGNKWRQTRGELAGRWARYGIATLTPWLPGAGPSRPIATYSPLSLERNASAIVAGFAALQYLETGPIRRELADCPDVSLQLDHSRQVLRTDCVSTPLLVYFASQWRTLPECQGLKAFVADDFQPSVAYNVFYLGPFVASLSGRAAAAMYCIWGRMIWSLAIERGWSLTKFFTEQAICLLAQMVSTSVGPKPRMVALRLAPPRESELASVLDAAVAQDIGRSPTSGEIRDWMFSREIVQWLSLGSLGQIVNSSFYQRYMAASDPFFPETIEPFCPNLPLLVIGRAGHEAIHEPGMPSFDERFHNMTIPKVNTLRSWGWDVRLCRGENRGTSFGEGPAQHWTLDELTPLLR